MNDQLIKALGSEILKLAQQVRAPEEAEEKIVKDPAKQVKKPTKKV